MRKILITGGAGFIGSHVVEAIVDEYPSAQIYVFDKMTYAADIENIAHVLKRGLRTLEVGDLCDFPLCMKLTRGMDCVINLAAESHVDHSFGNSIRFTQSNTLGTQTLIEACRVNAVPRIIHISTDEVYGETHHGHHAETDPLIPTNPYSASKAAADMIISGYVKSFNLPAVILRANNIFGPRQFPEKIIPRFCMQAICGRPFTIHGTGLNRRHYLSVHDFVDAVVLVLKRGEAGEIYNVGSAEEYTNLQVRDMIARVFSVDIEAGTAFVPDRPFNDFRYSLRSDKVKALGWAPRRSLSAEIASIGRWYVDNCHRYEHLFKVDDLAEERGLVEA